MKIIFTLLILLGLTTTIARSQEVSSQLQVAPGINCDAIVRESFVPPLLVIDGIVYEFEKLNKLNPDSIASIDIRKEVIVIGYCTVQRAIIDITTKHAAPRWFVVQDILTGDVIPKATIWFTSDIDSIKTMADDDGILIADKLKPGIKYDITVSSAGYKTLSAPVNGKEQEILLEREVRLCPEVVVVAYPTIRCVTYSSTCQKVTRCKRISVPDTNWSNASGFAGRTYFPHSSVYPNPVQRSNVFNLEWENTRDETMQLAVFSMTGNIVSLQSKKITKGINRLSITADAKWSAGIYNIQLRNEKGTLVRQEKIVVQ